MSKHKISKTYFFTTISCKLFAKIVSTYCYLFIILQSLIALSKSIRNYEKKMLGTSDAWSVVRLDKQTSETA